MILRPMLARCVVVCSTWDSADENHDALVVFASRELFVSLSLLIAATSLSIVAAVPAAAVGAIQVLFR